jgi:outer membrane receptor for ferrienterochelin and colicin/copper chaperone CopZ
LILYKIIVLLGNKIKYGVDQIIKKMRKILIIGFLTLFFSSVYTQSIQIKVSGECGMCQDRIEEVSSNTIGVNNAKYDLDTKELTLSFTSGLFNELELHQNLANAGHDTNKAKAPKNVYDALPLCCKYRQDEKELLRGMVLERVDGELIPLIGANIVWKGTSHGTVTGMDGDFSLEMSDFTGNLVVSYVGYKTDTIAIEKPGLVNIVLDNSVLIGTVEVVYKKKGTEISFLNPLKVEKINRKELTKAACCNLSESFETNPSVDVAFTDAVTGTKHIEMLGLAGPYVQITKEGLPDIRGLAALDGFTFIPGPWVDGIQLNHGTGSVINGFESVAGQINVELKKPHDEEQLHVNGYANINGRYEGNLVGTYEINDKFATALMLHGSQRIAEMDRNNDGFLDMPTTSSFIVSNRWRYEGKNGNEGQFGFKSTFNERKGGTGSLNKTVSPWSANSSVERHEAWIKRGKVFQNRPYASIGFMLSGTYHDLQSTYGNRDYNGIQKLLYANLLYSTILGNTDNKLTTGISFQGEQYDETFSELISKRTEYVPGVFGEYSYSVEEKIDLVLGLRVDYNSVYGFFVTPRFHFRYAFDKENVVRAVAGRGQRTANIFSENIRGMASNRDWIIRKGNGGLPFGLNPEIAWNTGLNYTRLWNRNGKVHSFGIDYYFTNFQNQVVVDYDKDPRKVNIYNLEGRSFSHSIKTQLDLSPADDLDIKLAYRYNVVQVDQQNGRVWKPLTARHRAFANIAYEFKGWKFDYTVNWIGSKRLPLTEKNPAEYQLADQSSSFWLHNAQITKVIKEGIEIYVGGENLSDFRQNNPILSAENPGNMHFDASMVWGPIFGRNVYAGFRYILAKEQ